jgi:hypothetical protein
MADRLASKRMQSLRLGAQDPVFYWMKSIARRLEASREEQVLSVQLKSVVGDGISL